MHDHVVARNPVDRSCHLVLVTGLQRIDDAKDFSGVAAGRSWVGEDEADGLLGVDDEDGADGEGLARESQWRSNTASSPLRHTMPLESTLVVSW
jgi:hypothetical protein